MLTPLLSRDLLCCVQFLFYFLLTRRNGFRLQLRLNILNLHFNHSRAFLPSSLSIYKNKYISYHCRIQRTSQPLHIRNHRIQPIIPNTILMFKPNNLDKARLNRLPIKQIDPSLNPQFYQGELSTIFIIPFYLLNQLCILLSGLILQIASIIVHIDHSI